MTTDRGILRIGTSNVVLPGNKETFPVAFQSSSRLHYYATLFNTVEINSTFYKVPQPATLGKWALDVPDNFQFTLKLWRDVTHGHGLLFDPAHIDYFMQSADMIGDRKGCLLIQFPASITEKHASQVEVILQRLKKLDLDNTWRKAIEFRHKSWYVAETYKMLDHYKASVILHDMPASKTTILNDKAEFVYLRFHGEKGDYKGSYSDAFLQEQAKQIKHYLVDGKDVYVYFNNTIGNAFENAQTLNDIIKS